MRAEATVRKGSNLPFRGKGGKVRNRRVSPVAPRPGEGPLTEPTAGAQPWPRERVLMPQRSRSRDWRDRARCAFGDPQRRRVLEHIRNLSHKNRTCAAIMLRSAASRVQPLG